MDKLNLSLDFGEDSSTEVTIEPLAKVEVVLARSMYLLDIVKSRHFSGNVEHVYLDLSKCNRNFTLGFFMKNLQASPFEVKLFGEKKMSLLIPLIKLLQIDKHFLKMMLPRKIDKNNVKNVHVLWSDQVYKDVVNDKYLINFHGAQTNVHLNIDQCMQLIHEIKICHGDYLVNHLPHCVCDNCSQFRHQIGIQMWNDCYPNPYFGPISNSPFPKIDNVKFTIGRPG
jgi:hypothetical protein